MQNKNHWSFQPSPENNHCSHHDFILKELGLPYGKELRLPKLFLHVIPFMDEKLHAKSQYNFTPFHLIPFMNEKLHAKSQYYLPPS